MSFWSAIGGVFKKVGHAAEKVGDIIEPFQGIVSLIPGPAGVIFSYVIQAEKLISADSAGADKKSAVVSFVKLAYPKLNPTVVSAEIDNLVGILNRLSAEVEKPSTQ